MLGHLLLEDLLQDCLNAFPDPGLYIAFHVMLELVLRGQAPPSSLNPQLTRRYRDLFNKYLYLWKYARGDEGPREYLVSVIGTEQGLSELLRSYITKTSLVFEGWIEKPEAGEHSELRVQP